MQKLFYTQTLEINVVIKITISITIKLMRYLQFSFIASMIISQILVSAHCKALDNLRDDNSVGLDCLKNYLKIDYSLIFVVINCDFCELNLFLQQ